MTAQEDGPNTTATATQGAAVFMALIAVVALGLVGFSMGYAKAGRSAFTGDARYAPTPGVAAARVSLVTAGEIDGEIVSAEVRAPAKPVSRPVAMIDAAAPAAPLAAESMDSTPASKVEPAAAEQTTVSEPV